VSSLEDYALEVTTEPEKDFNNAMGQESLTRFDQPKRKKKNNKKRRPNGEGSVATSNNARPNNPNRPRPNQPKITPNNRNENKQ
jgi:hypothetical protein